MVRTWREEMKGEEGRIFVLVIFFTYFPQCVSPDRSAPLTENTSTTVLWSLPAGAERFFIFRLLGSLTPCFRLFLLIIIFTLRLTARSARRHVLLCLPSAHCCERFLFFFGGSGSCQASGARSHVPLRSIYSGVRCDWWQLVSLN